MAITKSLFYDEAWTASYDASPLKQAGSTMCGPKSVSNACRVLQYSTIPTEQEVAEVMGTSTTYGTNLVNDYHRGVEHFIQGVDYSRISMGGTTIVSTVANATVQRPFVAPVQVNRAWDHLVNTIDNGTPFFFNVQFHPGLYPRAYDRKTFAEIPADAGSYPSFVTPGHAETFTHYAQAIGYHETDSGQRMALILGSVYLPFVFYVDFSDLCGMFTDRGYFYNPAGMAKSDQANDPDRLSAEAINALRIRVDEIEAQLGRKVDSDLVGYFSEWLRPGYIPIRKSGTGELTSYNYFDGTQTYRTVVVGMINEMIPEAAAAAGGAALKTAFEDAVKRIAGTVSGMGTGGTVDTSQFVLKSDTSAFVVGDKIAKRKSNGALNTVNNFNGANTYDCASIGMLATAFDATTATNNTSFKDAVTAYIKATVEASYNVTKK